MESVWSRGIGGPFLEVATFAFWTKSFPNCNCLCQSPLLSGARELFRAFETSQLQRCRARRAPARHFGRPKLHVHQIQCSRIEDPQVRTGRPPCARTKPFGRPQDSSGVRNLCALIFQLSVEGPVLPSRRLPRVRQYGRTFEETSGCPN